MRFKEFNFLKRITIPNLILFTGLLLSQTCLLFHTILIANMKHSSWVQDGFLYVCNFRYKIVTLFQIVALLRYLLLKPLKYYSHIYQFIVLPLFSALFLKQQNFTDNIIQSGLHVCVFIIGWSICLIMIITQYSKVDQQETQCIMKISINYRITKLIKLIFLVFLFETKIIQDSQLVFGLISAFSLFQLYNFLTQFTFQNPFHQYLLMVSSFGCLVSWLEFTFYNLGYSNYTYIGQCLFILIVVIQPQIFQKALEFKYQFYGQKNIQSREVHELLAFFIVMKEVIFGEHQTFQYTSDFEDDVYITLQKMLLKSKISSDVYHEPQEYLQRDLLSQFEVNLLKLMQKRLKQSSQFIASQFYLMTIVRKGINYKNKAIVAYYERRHQNKSNSSSTFSKIQMQLLYCNLIRHVQDKGKNSNFDDLLNFSNSLHEMSQRMVQLCRYEISMANLFQSSSQIPYQTYVVQLLKRYRLKKVIRQNMDQLNQNDWHISSGNFLYLCILYKIIFQRQTMIIEQKIQSNFVIPLALQNRKSRIQLSHKKNLSIVVFSIKQKGMIINQNQMFSKTYGMTVNTKKKAKKYITQLFPSLKQKNMHQQLMEFVTKYEQQEFLDHSTYKCFINKKVPLKSNKQYSSACLMSLVQQVKIKARIYYQIVQVQAYICFIQNTQESIGLKVSKNQIEQLIKDNYQFQVLSQQTVTQLGQTFQVSQIQMSGLMNSFYSSESQNSDVEMNISQKAVFHIDLQSDNNQKMEKMQKQHDNQQIKFNHRTLTIVLIMTLPLICIASNILSILFRQQKLQQVVSLLDAQKYMLEKTLLSQKIVGLHLLVYRSVEEGQVQNTVCRRFGVIDLKAYLLTDLKEYAENNFDQIQLSCYEDTGSNQKVSSLLNSNIYNFFNMLDQIQKTNINYIKYTSMVKSMIFQFLYSKQQSKRKSWRNRAIKQSINLSQVQNQGLYFSLRQEMAQSFQELSSFFTYSIIAFIGINFTVLAGVLIIFYRLVVYDYSHIQLVKDFKRPFVRRRIIQMDFILGQIGKLEKNYIHDVTIDKNMHLIMTQDNKHKNLDFKELELQSFLKIQRNTGGTSRSASVVSSQMQDQKELLLEDSHDPQTKYSGPPILRLLMNNIYKLITALLLFSLIVTLHVSHDRFLKQKSEQNLKYQDTFYEMGKLLNSVNDLLIGQWIKFGGNQDFSGKLQNQNRISRALSGLQLNAYQEKIKSLFPKKIADSIFFSSYCESAGQNKAQCQKIKAGVLNNGLVPMISFLIKDYDSSWNNPLSRNSTQFKQNQLCQKLVIFINMTTKIFGRNLINGYQTIKNEQTQILNQLKTAQFIVQVLLLLSLGVFAYIIIRKGQYVRSQVLSMDTKYNLYKNQQKYRPFLNQLYYKEEQD